MKGRLILLLMATVFAASGAVKLPGIFSDHAVLAKKSVVPVFGKADPGEKVVVSFNGQKVETVTGKNGKWRVNLNLADSPEGPFELKVNDLVIKDVIVGKVWLCSGQSNMAWSLRTSEGFAEACKKPLGGRLRSFNVNKKSQAEPSDELNGTWVYAQGEALKTFSGVGYFFGSKLLTELNAPVGLINDAWGGSPIEAWMTRESAKVVPAVAVRSEAMFQAQKEYPEKLKNYIKTFPEWAKQVNRTDTVHKYPAENAKWKKISNVRVPGGVIWIRNNFVTERDGDQRVTLKRQRFPFTVWLNGKKVFNWSLENALYYRYPKFTLKNLPAGKHELAFRIYMPVNYKMVFDTGVTVGRTKVSGKWEMFQELIFKNNIGKELAHPGINPPRPSFAVQRLFNGCIYGLAPYALDGVIWYQGEANGSRSHEYTALKRALIADWRKYFENPQLPFYWCSLANYRAKNSDPGAVEAWALFRDAQTAALDVPHTGQAILIDVGESHSIHPIDKKTPGERLAAIALANVYGKKVPFAGPMVTNVVREGRRLRISFKDIDGGLFAKELPDYYYEYKAHKRKAKLIRNSPDTQLEGFAVCGKDGKWAWADEAVIDGNTVIVSARAVAEPAGVRYAWQKNPTCNLYNNAGFPAVPFQRILNK